MQVGNTEVLFFIDYLNKKIHLMDVNRVGQDSLINIIDPTFQQRLVEQAQMLNDILDFDWICYGSDGVIALYKNYNFKILNSKLPYLHQSFIEEQNLRKNR